MSLPGIAGLSPSQLDALEDLLTAGGTASRENTRPELTVYYVPEPGSPPGEAELRAHTARLLPDEAVCLRFVPVTDLSSPSGDAARGDAGGRPDDAAASEDAVAPAGDLQRWLAAIWADVLDAPVTRVDADFFTLGGSSLRAVRVLARVQAVLGIELPVATLFGHRTVAALADAVEARSAEVPRFAEIVAVAAEVYGEEPDAGQR
ncbi:phosphopantetheine-binding protein [Streptomyces sp. NPDC101062]|uniref:phosphopantetheine-binding protein n=1 Tax=unclassified Streptomyces TaxID=2593676 RepID=UPI002E778BE0|nr:phosphopantetheine-binding protein [Streptomyces sp. JV176]MEE1798423.1 phosphopantetheine-binding protein [Streptomyces sp. JV176]